MTTQETSENTGDAMASFAEARGSAARWTREECLEGMWELYRDYCKMESERDGCSATRLPDYEDMLKQLEQHGMPAPPNIYSAK